MRTSPVPTLLPTTPTLPSVKRKHYNVLKSQDEEPSLKLKEHSMNLRVKDYVLRKLLVKKSQSNK